MDLGCLDLGCIEKKHTNEAFLDSDNTIRESTMSASKLGKNKVLKEAGQSNVTALNKFTSQVKKPPRRKSSPLSWFPRKKVDSYLKRKIKMLQEVGGMNSTLDETLGDSNLHYSKVLREKIAVREAAHKAMEARKAAMVEASWCRILRAARIEDKEAEALLLTADKNAAEAFEAATSIGVIMHDIADCSQKHYEIETLSADGGSTTHTVTASFETAFDVDKQVAAAVKAAFIRLANCPSINKDEFKELLRRISENPAMDENNQELSEFSSECESDTGSELESGTCKDDFGSTDLNSELEEVTKVRHRKYKKRQMSENFNTTKLVDMMLERLRRLQEDELASLATIVATCGLNAALAEAEISKHHDLGSATDNSCVSGFNYTRRMSNFGEGTVRNFNVDGQKRKNHTDAELLPRLDKFLVKHLTRLEREVQEAKNARKNEAREGTDEKPEEACLVDNNIGLLETNQGLGSILLKHSSKFEKEIAEAKKNSRQMFANGHKKSKGACNGIGHTTQDVSEVPSLDKYLVKHFSKLEKEVQEAKNRGKIELIGGGKINDSSKEAASTTSATQLDESSLSCYGDKVGKENIDLNTNGDKEEYGVEQKEITPTLSPQNTTDCSDESLIGLAIFEAAGNDESKDENSLDKILLKPVHRLEREKMLAKSSDYENQQSRKKQGGNREADCEEGLDKVLVKHVSRLEKEKMALGRNKEMVMKVKKRGDASTQLEKSEGSLDQILVKHKSSRLEREKMAAAAQQPESNSDQIKHSVTRREARQRELAEAWGGLSLGNSVRPHVSRLERDKAAWLKAEEEERRRAEEEM